MKTFTPTVSAALGYRASGISFTRRQNGRAVTLATIQSLTGRVSWFSLLTWNHRIESLQADGLGVFVPLVIPKPPAYPTEERLQAVVEKVTAAGAMLRVQRRNQSPDINLSFSTLQVVNVGKNRQMSIAGTAHNRTPAADLSIKGVFGPFLWSDMKRTSISGSINVTHLDLSQLQGAGGTASGNSTLNGPFNHLRLRGSLLSPDFYSRDPKLATELSLDFAALLDGATGNAWFEEMRTHFGHSDITGNGSAIYDARGRRRTELFLQSANTDCDDVSSILLSRTSPIRGKLNFDAHSEVLSGAGTLAERLNLTGGFRITELRFRKKEIQTRLEKLQQRIERHQKRQAASAPGPLTLAGTIAARLGAAHLSKMRLNAAGLSAAGEGELSLTEPALDMRGEMKLDTSLSRALGGWKGFFALPLNPFFRDKNGTTTLPFELKGPLSNPTLKTSLRRAVH